MSTRHPALAFAPPEAVRREAAYGPLQRTEVALAAGCGLFLLLTLPKLLQVWTTGIFLNPDDAMRAVEVRDFMAGQEWFDLVPHRLSPDHPFTMHWSRLIDAPLALLVWLFGLVMPWASAELCMRLVEPALLFAASLALMLSLVRDLVGRGAMLPAALLLAGSVEFVSNYLPGHIHHHAAQATLLLAITKLTFDHVAGNAGWRSAALAGVLTAVSLGIGLQSLPFMVGIAAIFALDWAWRGGAARPGLAAYGSGLAGGAAVVFALDVPPSAYTQGACDAFSAVHLLAAVLGGAGFLILGSVPSPGFGRGSRFAGVAAVAGLTLCAVAAFYPACLRDPMAGVDPLLRERWLANVGEALPLTRLIVLDPAGGFALALTLAFGLAATVLALRESVAARRSWLALLLMCLIGLTGTIYQVRVAASTCAFMIPGVAWLALRTFDTLARRPKAPALLIAILVGLIGNGAALTAIAGPAGRLFAPGSGSPPAAATDPAACFEPAAYEGLKTLPAGLVLSTIDPGSTILAYTPHSVLAAPYHRNSFGNRVALLALEAPPAEALPLIRNARADYLVLCRSSNETAETVRLNPESLSARLIAGDVPPGFTPIGPVPGPMLIFRVDRGAEPDHPSSPKG